MKYTVHRETHSSGDNPFLSLSASLPLLRLSLNKSEQYTGRLQTFNRLAVAAATTEVSRRERDG